MPQTPEQEYQQIIEQQRQNLLELQAAFNKKCAAAKDDAQSKLKAAPPEDKEAQQKILLEQKEKLENALKELKTAIRESTKVTMRQLEEVIRKREVSEISKLEQEIQSLQI